jgi:predicted nucleic acid-binding protein
MNIALPNSERNVLVDICIWSLLLRRHNVVETPLTLEFQKLVKETRIMMLGVVRQEVLSGIREKPRFELIRQKLRAFPDFPVSLEDYETAAEFYNSCRAKGVQGSLIDFLLCAVSHRHQLPIFTTDKDFEYFQKYVTFELYSHLTING